MGQKMIYHLRGCPVWECNGAWDIKRLSIKKIKEDGEWFNL